MSLYGLCLGLHMPRGSLLIWCGLFIGPYRRFTMNAYACSPPASLVYFEISISTHRRLNVDCNSRIDVLWPTHTHIRAHAHLQSTLSSFCYIFVLFLMWFPSVYWSRRTGLGRRTDKEFCNLRWCGEDFFLSLDWPDTIWEKLQILIGLTANGFMRQYVCHTHTNSHIDIALAELVAVLANT